MTSMRRNRSIGSSVALLATTFALLVAAAPATAQGGRKVTFTDLMKVRQIDDPAISADGRFLAYTAAPDRGNPEVVIHSVDGAATRHIGGADNPVFAPGSRWLAARLAPTLAERDTAEDRSTLRNGLELVDLTGGRGNHVAPEARSFAFSADGRFLAYLRYADEPEEGPSEDDVSQEGSTASPDDAEGDRDADDDPGADLVIRSLGAPSETVIHGVSAYRFANEGSLLAYTVSSEDDARDGLYVRDLTEGTDRTVDTRPDGGYEAMTWSETGSHLAFWAADDRDQDVPTGGAIMGWNGRETDALVSAADTPDGWTIPSTTSLEWSDDGRRLFFGWRPLRADELEAAADDADRARDRSSGEPSDGSGFDPYDVDDILADRGVDVWHWQDPRINPQQKVMWNREKDRTYTAVHHLDRDRTVALASLDVPDVEIPTNDRVALASSDVPYRWEFTWRGGQSDTYIVNVGTGERTLVAERLRRDADLSPGGRYVVWYDGGHYHLRNLVQGTTRNLTEVTGAPFADEDHDYPDPAPGYGVAGWTKGDEAVLLYDKYDIWVVPTAGGRPWSLTDGAGRRDGRIFRLIDTDDEDSALADDETVLLSSYHDLRKSSGFYAARLDRPGVTRLIEDDRRFAFVARADSADRYVFTREDYDEFPDLWVADTDFHSPRKVTDANPDLMDTYAWGHSELVEWSSADGTPLQGVIIKPDDYQEGRRYPVLVYYYRFFSQRLHEFNDPSVNHRPSFPVYASDGYVVFLPDVRFEVGRPGLSATKSVVPGVQRLIDMGIADPDAIALHGHSWSGYQTAFMVTQTDMFRTAVAGAPVANMTSAYSGIRLGSGLARQFQYEMGQSRISGSLWEARDEYIDNSPIFFADRIKTPMLILHGDVDDAVPWEQSIELYLALRRLGKEAVFLQYRDEPHHPQTYANKLDWAMKMKEWIDHYLKGAPAPEWITTGMPYSGK